jgi:hypothetical protein
MGATAAAAVVLGQQPLFDILVQPIKVDIGEDGGGDTALWGSGQCGVPPPILQIPGLEHATDQPQKPAIVDLLR